MKEKGGEKKEKREGRDRWKRSKQDGLNHREPSVRAHDICIVLSLALRGPTHWVARGEGRKRKRRKRGAVPSPHAEATTKEEPTGSSTRREKERGGE